MVATSARSRLTTSVPRPRRHCSPSWRPARRRPDLRRLVSLQMPQEIEIKLSVEPEHAQRLWAVLALHPHRKPATRRLFSAYYDTPDLRLQNSGVALRLRREGKRWIQTVQRGGIAGR